MPDAIKLLEKFAKFDEQWSPHIVGKLNDHELKIAKVEGEFIFHKHDNTDELFLVVKGSLMMHYRERTVTLQEGDICIVPQGVEHKPEAPEECYILMIERVGTTNTGDQTGSERTVVAKPLD